MKKKKAEVAAIEAQEILQNGIHNNCEPPTPISDSHDSPVSNGQSLVSKDNNHDDDNDAIETASESNPSSVETKVEQAAISQIEKLHLKDQDDQAEKKSKRTSIKPHILTIRLHLRRRN